MSEETIMVNIYQSDEHVPTGFTEHDTNVFLKNLYGALTKYVDSKGFRIFPHRPGVRFFIENTNALNKLGEHEFVIVQPWSGTLNEIRFHDGFVAQFEFIDDKVWLKVDARQLVLLKGNEQNDQDFSVRSSYVAYCPFCYCENRSNCPSARLRMLKSVHFVTSENELTTLRESLGYGCHFYSKLKYLQSAVKAESKHDLVLLPWLMVYFKGAIADMPSASMRSLYRNRCLLKSNDRFALTNLAFSTLSNGKTLDLPFQHAGNKISFRNMFEGKVKI